MKRVSVYQGLIGVFLVLLVASPTLAVDWTWGVCDCGWFGEDCDDAVGTCEMGYFYDSRAIFSQACNGPCESATQRCFVSVTATTTQKITVSGSISYEFFGLEAGYENEQANVALAEYEKTCDDPNCCVGPAAAYWRYFYVQKVRQTIVASELKMCLPCAPSFGRSLTYDLSMILYTTEGDYYSPELYTQESWCAWWGQ
ncbi:MAG TPA: hypothetical protein VMZ31_19340 [Phycisphaerae bacterium]|nr:hypothetical protein [Phycisphaerae bacterium]